MGKSFYKRPTTIFILLIATTLSIVLYLRSSDPIDLKAPTAQEIQTTIEHAFDVIALGQLNLDCSQYAGVFIDTKDYKIKDQKLYDLIEQELGPGTANNAGYLTAMTAKCEWYSRIMPVYKTYLEDAEAENRELTMEEWDELEELSLGYGVPAPIEEKYYSPDFKVDSTVVMQSIELDPSGNRAVARFDDHAAVQEAIFVKVDGRWFISSIIAINIHY